MRATHSQVDYHSPTDLLPAAATPTGTITRLELARRLHVLLSPLKKSFFMLGGVPPT